MKRSITHNYIGNRRKHSAADVNYIGFNRIVKRCKWCNFTNPTHIFIGYNLRFGNVPTTLYNTVSNSCNFFAQRLNNLKNVLDSVLVRRKSNVHNLLFATKLFVTNKGAINTNTLTISFCKYLFGIRI